MDGTGDQCIMCTNQVLVTERQELDALTHGWDLKPGSQRLRVEYGSPGAGRLEEKEEGIGKG
jgi:hypothetical protein